MLFEWLFQYRFSSQPRGTRPIHDKERCLGCCLLRVEPFGEALCRAVHRRKTEHEKQDDRGNCGNHISNENKLSGRHRSRNPAVRSGAWPGDVPPPWNTRGPRKPETTPKYSNRKRNSGSLGTRDNRILRGDDLPLPIAL
jgi:hypothetical protein